MLLYDLSHTSHSQARTGVQRVTLELRRALQATTPLTDVTYDPHQKTWRTLQGWETVSLSKTASSTKRRGAYWPLPAQLKGIVTRTLGRKSDIPESADGLVTAEIFTARTGQNLSKLFRNIRGPKVAVFHDAISLRMPQLAPPGTVGRFPTYLSELRQFDGIMAVSEDSKNSLEEYWQWADWKNTPPVRAISLGLDHLPTNEADEKERITTPLTILTVGSIEGRKNHLTLLNAAEQLWAAGKHFKLRLIGSLQRQTGAAAMSRIHELQRNGRPIQYDGWLSDTELNTAYTESAFTVYPSLLEGFGLPVWESLLHGRPCICSSGGATGETARGGGCLSVNTNSTEEVARAMTALMENPDRLAEFRAAASSRTPPTWATAAQSLHEWMGELRASIETK